MRTGPDAIEHGRRQIDAPTRSWDRLCLMFVRTCFGVAARHPDAITAWEHAEHKTGRTPVEEIPAGVPVWWRGGTWGHVALSVGDGYCLSNDILRRGDIDLVRIDLITERWGFAFLGWSTDINGRIVYEAPRPAPSKPAPAAREGVFPTYRDAAARELRLIDILTTHALTPHQREVRTAELAQTYKTLRTYPASQRTLLEREYATRAERAARERKPETAAGYQRLGRRLDHLHRKGAVR